MGDSILYPGDEESIGIILNKRFKLNRVIGAGSFGKIFHATDLNSQNIVAVKIANAKDETGRHLDLENKFLGLLKGGDGICAVYYFGREGLSDDYITLVMDCLGPNLEELLRYCSQRFTLKTTCMLAIQMISRLEFLHSKRIVHRDIKPDNFALGIRERFTTVYVIDFGLSKSYYIPGMDQHVPYAQTHRMTGTARYCSINAHNGIQLSRRDDMESLGYLFIYFLKGELPWQGIHAAERAEKFKKIHAKKSIITPKELCTGLPREIQDYVIDTRSLLFEEVPEYKRLKQYYWGIMKTNNFKYDCKYDWLQVREQRREKQKAGIMLEKAHSQISQQS